MKKFFLKFALYALFASLIPEQASFARESGWVQIPTGGKLEKKSAKKPAPAKNVSTHSTVYDNQPPVTEAEVKAFLVLLPTFRAWARQNGEIAHPVLNMEGKPDFTYSTNAARWVRAHKFDPPRFFCIMGRMAAGVVIVEEGNDFKGTRPADMPSVNSQELGLVRKHLGSLQHAGGTPQPIQ